MLLTRFCAPQLYDRYLHRYFDAVPTCKVQNAPGAPLLTARCECFNHGTDVERVAGGTGFTADVLKHLQDGFEFVLCEVGTGSELCDAQRGCSVCCKWAAL